MFWTVAMLVSSGVLLAGGAMYVVCRSLWRALPENVGLTEVAPSFPNWRTNKQCFDKAGPVAHWIIDDLGDHVLDQLGNRDARP